MTVRETLINSVLPLMMHFYEEQDLIGVTTGIILMPYI